MQQTIVFLIFDDKLKAYGAFKIQKAENRIDEKIYVLEKWISPQTPQLIPWDACGMPR